MIKNFFINKYNLKKEFFMLIKCKRGKFDRLQ